MGFWLYCLVMSLLCPGVMIYFGRRFLKCPPEKINRFYGYRTRRSMSGQAAWAFAHRCCGRLWLGLGLVSAPLTALAMLGVLGADAGAVGLRCGIAAAVQLALMLATLPVVEGQLKKKFHL